MAIGTGTQVPATLSLASNSYINVATINIETTEDLTFPQATRDA